MFITLEGVDGSGKSTQAALLAEALGASAVLLREPGGTEAAERIRLLLADPETPLDPLAELLLFCAARADLVNRVIKPSLAQGKVVICDRFTDSTIAYQGVARNLGIVRVREISEVATDGLAPDLTLLLEIDPSFGLDRAESDDRFEAEGVRFQERVAEAYEDIARREPRRVIPIDGRGSPQEVHRLIMDEVESRLPA
ncbi:MAG: dTMP kinase [Solirubrobacterales bacterium]|nr:dTMP kinase [Solirubrobacterales bacterium]HMT05752.1 dTMP kinase [Solirubrobacterales bacterium]